MTRAPSAKSVYAYPQYYDIGYRWRTVEECDFLEACFDRFASIPVHAVLDAGCGSGRHLRELARRGFRAIGFDPQPEMVQFVREQARRDELDVDVYKGSLASFQVTGTVEAAICLMDTFRFLLTSEEITAHLRAIAERLAPGGLYVLDFWVPSRWDAAANEVYQWEQEEDGVQVRVLYVQYPETTDPVAQTFEDELIFQVTDQGRSLEICGGRTRTRLILPQEFRTLVAASGVFDLCACLDDFDLEHPLASPMRSWRMVSVLRKR